MPSVEYELVLVGSFFVKLHNGVFAKGKTMCTQVFDSGLIGEGVLHMLLWAKEKLLTEDVVLVSPE